MNDVNKELDAIKLAKPVDQNWLKEPFVGLIKIKEIKLSENEKKSNGEAYSGKPYFKILIITKTLELSTIMFWREIEGDDPKKNEDKRNKLKKFLDHAGADETKSGLEYLNSIVGKKLKAVLKKIEEFSTSPEGVPQILTKIIYSYSCKETEDLGEVNLSQLVIPLSKEDREKFNSAIATYEAMMGGGQPIPADNSNPDAGAMPNEPIEKPIADEDFPE